MIPAVGQLVPAEHPRTPPIIHLVLGVAMLTGSLGQQEGEEARFFGLIFVVIASLFILCGLAYSILLVFTGKNLAHRQRYVFCLVMACLTCAFMPLGTVLGVFTIIVLNRESVKQLFDDPPGTGSRPADATQPAAESSERVVRSSSRRPVDFIQSEHGTAGYEEEDMMRIRKTPGCIVHFCSITCLPFPQQGQGRGSMAHREHHRLPARVTAVSGGTGAKRGRRRPHSA